METVGFSLLRGVCQTPAYVAQDRGFFAEVGVDAQIDVAPTAWVVPQRLAAGELDFAVIPWTRVAAAKSHGEDLVLVCGSGFEEAALVVRPGVELAEVKTVAVPQEGGMKDLTAAGLMRSLTWNPGEPLRLPSGDAAILSFVGRAADAASMVEPFASMLEFLGMGIVMRRTGDVWPGAPGCSLTTSRRLIEERPELVRSVVAAFVRGADHLRDHADDAAEVASRYIGVSAEIVRKAFDQNRPNVRALHNVEAMDQVLSLMIDLGYIKQKPEGFAELSFLNEILG